jgi:hypothetical protein
MVSLLQSKKGVSMKNTAGNLLEAAAQMKPAKVKKAMKDHSQAPFFVKKVAAAKKKLANITLPKTLTGKK